MGSFEIQYADESACRQCGTFVPLTLEQCGACGNHMFRLNAAQFFAEVERKNIIDARHGGLVIGRSGRIDDIPMFQSEGNGIYSVIGLMHGGEYIESNAATRRYGSRFEEINAEAENGGYGPFSFSVSEKSIVLNCDVLDENGGLWIDFHGQFIINSFATSKHYQEIERLNFEVGTRPFPFDGAEGRSGDLEPNDAPQGA